jgi:hypothetical protein
MFNCSQLWALRMGRVGQNRQGAINRKPTALIEIVRLLARQAAREWTERLPKADHSASPHARSEEPS